VEALRGRGADVLTTLAAGLAESDDEFVLAFAHASGRVVVTADRDFLDLDRGGFEHSGIVLLKDARLISHNVEGLSLIFEAMSAEEFVSHVEFW
jgi:predicted nuclease of predicted toxin-antitoxin system